MIKMQGRGAHSRRPFYYELTFKDQAAHLKAIHESGRPTALAVFEISEFLWILTTASSRLARNSEAISVTGRRSSGGNSIQLTLKVPDTRTLRVVLKDSSGKTINATDFARREWETTLLRSTLRRSSALIRLDYFVNATEAVASRG